MSSIREVDLSRPVNEMLQAYAKVTNKKPGDHLFSTKNQTPLSPSSLRKYALIPLGIPGFHSLRRWRVSYLKSIGTPESLLRGWIGHSNGNDITARYDKSADDKQWRQEWANKVGIGFDLPALTPGHPAPKSKKNKLKPKPKIDTLNIASTTEPTYAANNQDLDPFFYSTPVRSADGIS